MNQIERIKGITILKIDKWTVRTNKISRYRYNDLRKRHKITIDDLCWAIGLKKQFK